MKISDFPQDIEPRVGDILEIEQGDVCFEVRIIGITADGYLCEQDNVEGAVLLEGVALDQDDVTDITGYITEERVRLDPKCWKGKKIGNPKTKMKGGVRVNNCVPEGQEIEEAGPFRSTEPKKPRKGSVADLAARKRAEQDRTPERQREIDAIGNKNHYVGTARVRHDKSGVEEGSDLPPRVIEMIKKIAQSSASPEHKKAAIDALVAKYSKQGVAEGLINEKIAEGIVYATGPRSHGINDVDLIFKNLRTKKIVASVLGNNDHGGIYEIKIDQNGLKPQSPINFVAMGNPQDGSGEHVVYKLSSNRGNDAKEFSTMRNGFDTRNNTYYGMKMDFIGDDDYWSFLENMIGDIMWEDDAIEAGYVDRLDNGDLVFVKNQGVAEGSDDIRKKISKFEELALQANKAGDDAKSKMYQQKIQSLKQKMSQGIQEGSDNTVSFEVDSENAYNRIMKKFRSVIDWDGDTMVAPRKYWDAIQELASQAGGEAIEVGNEQGVAETSDYFRRREREEGIISGKRPARKKAPAQTSDYAKRREQEKKAEQGVAEGSDKLQGTPTVSLSDFDDKDNKKNKYGQTVPKKLKKDDPRVKFHKDEKKGVAEGYTGRETKDGTWRVFKDGKAVAVAGPFKSREEAAAWIKKQKQGVNESTEQSLQKKIQSRRDALGLAREQRRARGQHQQGQREIKLQAEIDNLNDQLRELKKQGVKEGRYFRTAYGYAGGYNEKTGGKYKHPEDIRADREAKKKTKDQEQAEKKPEQKVQEGPEEHEYSLSMGNRQRPGSDRLDTDSRSRMDSLRAQEHDLKQRTINILLKRHPDLKRSDLESEPSLPKLIDMLRKPANEDMDEAKYQGREVPLGKKMAGDVAKSKVYVRKPNGKVVKVNFGDKNMTIKKSNPKRRKSFRARHNCDNPGPRWRARYWSCRSW